MCIRDRPGGDRGPADRTRGTHRVQHRVRLVDPVDVGVQPVGRTQADVVGDDDGDALREEPVDRQILITHGHGLAVEGQRVFQSHRRGALVALPQGAGRDRDEGARAGAGPVGGRFDVGAGDGDGLPVRVRGLVHQAGRGAGEGGAVEPRQAQREGERLAADECAVGGGEGSGRVVELGDGDASGHDVGRGGGGCGGGGGGAREGDGLGGEADGDGQRGAEQAPLACGRG